MPQNAQAQTQGGIQFETVDINLFPEFNQPSIYTTVDIKLIDSITLPRELTILIPADINDIAVLYRDEDGFFHSPEVRISQDRFWKYLNFSTPSASLRIEYNDTNLVIMDVSRTYDFRWSSLYPIYYFTVGIYQPEGISQFEINKNTEVSAIIENGIRLSTLKQSPLPSDRLFEFSFSYVKTGDISYPGMNVEARDGITNNTPGKVPAPLNLALWLFFIGLSILVLVGLYFFWFRKRTAEQRGIMVQGLGIMNPEKMAVFCHECGMRSKPGENYCSNCGTELRKPTSFVNPTTKASK